MKTNILKDRVLIQTKTTTQTSTGSTEVWRPVQTVYARVVPLSVQSKAQYQQLNSEVSHQVVLRGSVTLNKGDYRFKWGNKTLEPAAPPKLINNMTVIIVKED